MSWTSHSLVSAVCGLPEKCRPITTAPRRSMRHEATGESMPLLKSEMTLPALPTGSPPTPSFVRT